MKAKKSGLKFWWMAAVTLNRLAICGQGLEGQRKGMTAPHCVAVLKYYNTQLLQI